MVASARALYVLPLLFSLALVAAGCLNVTAQPAAQANLPAATPKPAAATPTAQPTPTLTPISPVTLKFAAGPANTDQYNLAKTIADVWMARIPGLKVQMANSDGQSQNLRLLDGGGADVIFVRDDLATLAANQQPPFSDRAIQVATMAGTYWDVVQVIAAADTGIATSRQISGRKATMPPFDSASQAMLDQVLAAGRFEMKDFPGVIQVPDQQAAEALATGKTEEALTTGPVPLVPFQQAAQQRPVRIVPVAEGWGNFVLEKYPAFSTYTIPAGTYNGQDADVPTVGTRTILAVRRNMPEDVAHALARALVEGQPEIAARNPIGKEITPESVTVAVHTPFHPAAVRAYRELGVLK